MSVTSQQIETIVREVMRRLEVPDTTPFENLPQFTLALHDSVITLATLERKLDGVSVLEVSRKAVVTPAVLDLLREKSISLLRRGNETKQTDVKVLLGADDHCEEISVVAGWIHDRRLMVENLAGGSIDVLAGDLMRRHLRESAKSIVVSSRPFYFSCKINRSDAIRAIVALNASMAKQAATEMDANVLVMDADHTCPKIVNEFLDF